MLVQEPVQAAIWHCLNHYAYADAVFLAERLHAELGSEESVFLLATCYYRSGRTDQAFWLLSNSAVTTPNARYLLAKCALDLEKLAEAEAAVSGAETDFGDAAPFALQLLARVYRKTERRDRAAESHLKALRLNPFLWDSFARICRLGKKADAQEIFRLADLKNPSACFGRSAPVSAAPDPQPEVRPVPAEPSPPTGPTPTRAGTPDSVPPNARLRSVFGATLATPFSPSFGVVPLEESPVTYTPTLTDANEQKALPKLMHSFRAQVGQLREAVFSPAPRQPHAPPQHVRRSSRLFSNSYSVKENNKSPNRKFVAPKSPSKKSKQRTSKANANKAANVDGQQDAHLREAPEKVATPTPTPAPAGGNSAHRAARQSSEGLMALMRSMGEAYSHLSSLECRRALELLEELPPRQYESPWVQSLLAVARHELAEYEAAARHFAAVRAAQPLRTQHLDVYSTCLWHLQREAELSALARELVGRDRREATAWIVAGNCFSLHKEHDTAVRFFRRAVQLEPDRPYAHTLLGHEYVATEETDKALASFRTAVRLDPRHYNAWFGIATVFSKQERFRDAEVHFRRALAIHPESGVLRCHLGVVLIALGQPERALSMLDLAVKMDPTNPLCRFHKASVLSSVGQLKEALEELEELKDLVPKESLVYYLLGKVHNKLGNSDLALMHFSWATDLDPKGTSGHMKEAFDPARAENPPDAVL